MKNHIRQIIAFAAVAVFATVESVQAYGQYYVSHSRRYAVYGQQQTPGQQPIYYAANALNIDFIPAERTNRRYALALQPLVLFNNGMRLDFEVELRKPGNWLQIGLSGYYTQWFEDKHHSYYYWRSGWATFNSGFEEYQKLGGAGLSLAHKNMISRNGFYVSYGASFIYYDVHHYEQGLFPYVADGITFYEQDYRIVNTKFYRPTAFVNLGRTFGFQSGMIFDVYGGMGYTHSVYETQNNYTAFNSGWMSFGYRGFHLTGGVRIGVLWPNKLRDSGVFAE